MSTFSLSSYSTLSVLVSPSLSLCHLPLGNSLCGESWSWLSLLMLSADAAPLGTAIRSTTRFLSPFSSAGNVWGWPCEAGSCSPGAAGAGSSSVVLPWSWAGSARGPGASHPAVGQSWLCAWRAQKCFAQLSLSPSCSVLCPAFPAPKPAEFPKNPTFPCPWGQGLPSPGSATRALQPSMPKPCWRTCTQTWKSPHLRSSHPSRIPTETGSVHGQHHRAWGQGPSTAAAKITPAPACTCSPGN